MAWPAPGGMSVHREWGGGGVEAALNLVTKEGGCMAHNNGAHGGGKMGRAQQLWHWMRKDSQRLRNICHPGDSYR